MEFCGIKSRNAWSHQELDKGKKRLPVEASEGVSHVDNLDFRLLASRTGKEEVSPVLSHQICGDLLWSQRLVTWKVMATRKIIH